MFLINHTNIQDPSELQWNEESALAISAPSQINVYRACLRQLISYTDNKTYDKHHKFSTDRLSQLTALDVYRFMAFKTYGKPNPSSEDWPIEGRSFTIDYHKKAISYFMPNKNQDWDERAQTGNPTKSTLVGRLLAAVRRHEHEI